MSGEPMMEALLPAGAFGGESRRLLHGRGGCFPGLEHVVIDWFAPVLLVTLYAERAVNGRVVGELEAVVAPRPEVRAVVVQERHLPRAPKRTVFGELPEEVFAREGGLRFLLNLTGNQNHGFFPDMQPGRAWVREQAGGKRVLNLFAYTCSLSVAALAGGAASVTNLDLSSRALATGRANHRLNFGDPIGDRVRYLAHDLFKSWGKLRRGGPYDLIVVDPPSRQVGSFVAEKDYPRVVRRLGELLGEGGRVLACLNAPHLDEPFLTGLFQGYRLEGRLPRAAGFDERDPPGALKCLVFAR